MIQLKEQMSEARDQKSASYSSSLLDPRASTRAELSESEVAGLDLSTIDNPPLASLRIALLTGGGDKPYALGIAAALTSAGIHLDFIGSDDLKVPDVLNNSRVNFLNLRGDQRPEASTSAKILRVLRYYAALFGYVTTTEAKVLHLLWNNKFELFDRTLLMLYYKLLGKKIVFTAHNVNAGKRDCNDSWLNRVSLKVQYSLSDHVFVHTEGMKSELLSTFGVSEDKVSVVPFGINNTVADTSLSNAEAKRRLHISSTEKTLLFFGNIAPYKGLEYLVAAFTQLLDRDRNYRLVIAGRPKEGGDYWEQIQESITRDGTRDRIIERIEYIPDDETELYFKAVDVLVLPYAHVFQSGVLFLGYSFGLPAIAADVGNLKEEIIEGETGFVFRPRDSYDLACTIDRYFQSDLFRNLESRRAEIKAYANDKYSWDKVAAITTLIYSRLLACDF
jgi:D-inositol-3-phosphate glycosyltransferase